MSVEQTGDNMKETKQNPSPSHSKQVVVELSEHSTSKKLQRAISVDEDSDSDAEAREEGDVVMELPSSNKMPPPTYSSSDSMQRDIEQYAKAAHKRNFHSVLAKDTVAERKKKVHMTLFWGEGASVTGRKHSRVIDIFSDPNGAGEAAPKAIESVVPRLVDEQSTEQAKFGTWDGVWVSCMLNIFGVIMYLRLGWVVGNAGILGAIAIILLSGAVTLLTTLSMSAIATNGNVKGGGAYFLISRSVGPAIGASIGVLFTIGLCIAVSLYVIGFCDSILEVMGTQGNVGGVMYEVVQGFGEVEIDEGVFVNAGNSITGCYVNDIRILGILVCTVLILMAIIGIGWVINLQLFLIALILATILSFLIGTGFVDTPTWNHSFDPNGTVARPAEGFMGWGFVDENGDSLIMANLFPKYAKKTSADTKIDFSNAANFGSSIARKFTGLGSALSCAASPPSDNGNTSLNVFNTSSTAMSEPETFGEYSFFEVFAIFFPACTGIMAGANISGLLANPGKNIPTGTLHAVLWSTIGYSIMAIFVGAVTTREALQTNYFIMNGIELTPWLVWAGIFAATFSSALASIIGAPQLLMAVAKDDLMDCLAVFKKTHKRVGCTFVEAPLLDSKMNPNFVRKLRIYLVCEVFKGCSDVSKVIHEVIDGTLEGAGKNANMSDKMRYTKLKAAAEGHQVGKNLFGCSRLASSLTELRLQIIDRFLHRGLKQIGMLRDIRIFEKLLYAKLTEKNLAEWNARIKEQGGRKKRTGCCCVGCCQIEDPADPAGLGGVAAVNFISILNEVVSEAPDIFRDVMPEKVTLSTHAKGLCEYISGFDYDNMTPMLFGNVITEADPMIAYGVSYVLACGCVCLGNLDIVAPLISMFFMLTYCLVNAAVFVQILSRAPGWRPSFKAFNGFSSFLGALLCFVSMFLIDEFWAVVSIIIALIIFVVITIQDPATNWGAAPQAIESMRVMNQLLKMRRLKSHTKTFRPHIMAICDATDKYSPENAELMRFAYCMRKGFGLTMLGVVQSDVDSEYVQDMVAQRENVEDTFFQMREPRRTCGKSSGAADYRRYALIENVVAQDIRTGGRILLTTAGIGKMRPNTLLLTYPRDWTTNEKVFAHMEMLFKLLEDAMKMRFHVMLFRGKIDRSTCMFEDEFAKAPASRTSSQASKAQSGSVDVWWITDDGAMSLLTPHLMLQSSYWQNCTDSDKPLILHHVTNRKLHMSVHQEEEMKMKSFLRKHRLNWPVEVEALVDINTGSTAPSEATVHKFENLHASIPPIKDMDTEVQTWTNSWLRISEVITEAHALKSPKCIYVTLPFPRAELTAATYFGWLEMMADIHDDHGNIRDVPVCFIRGNGKDVVTEEMD
jgi:amino acid transporter